jgi:Uma2 family endonuclease
LCGNQLAATTPSVIIEVLSSTTEGYDKGRKLRCYRQIPDLKQIILIAQNKPTIDIYTKNEKGEWISTDVIGIEKSLNIAGKDVLLAEIYHDIDLSIPVND